VRWLLFSLVLAFGIATSQEPIPSPTKDTESSKTHVAKGKQKAKQDQRGTANSPLVVDVIRPQKNEAEAAQDSKDHNDKATEARFSFWFNFLLVLFNGILAVSTVLLWLVTGRAARAAEESAKASVIALTDLERPWIFIEKTHIKRREDAGTPIVPNYYWISFVCRNVGRAPAIVEECIIKIQDIKTLPEIPDYSDPIHLGCPATISVGTDFETSVVGPPSQPGVDPNKATEYVIYGRLIYKELGGKRHHSRFAVQVSPLLAAAMPYFSDAYDGYD